MKNLGKISLGIRDRESMYTSMKQARLSRVCLNLQEVNQVYF